MTDRLPHEKGFHISWDQIHRDARALAWRLDKQGPLEDGAWKAVVAITRGGMAPAMIAARELDIRIVDTISVKSYDHQNQSEAMVLKSPDSDLMGDGTGILVIDDLVDSGRTLELVRESFPNGLCQTQRPSDGGHVHHRSQPRYVDLFPVGYGTAICGTVPGEIIPDQVN
jgi:xanthine phosphoribosyltransferase